MISLLLNIMLTIMCTNTRVVVNKYTGKDVRVKCGTCAACLQEKANRNESLIRKTLADGKYSCIIATLTYSNGFVPFVYRENFSNLPLYYNDVSHKRVLQVYRLKDYKRGKLISPRWPSPNHFLGRYEDFAAVPTRLDDYRDIKRLKGTPVRYDYDTIGILWYKDVTDFMKRFRSNLKRYNNYDKPFKYFYVGEYGPTTLRPHFHILFFFDEPKNRLQELYSQWKDTFFKSWPYDIRPISLRQKTFEIARNAAKYVSHYVNCTTTLPLPLQGKEWSPRTFHSIYLGENHPNLCAYKVLRNFNRGSLRHTIRQVAPDGTTFEVSVPLPSYILHRYFPKIKGYSRLSNDEVVSIYRYPERLYFYGGKLGYRKDQFRDDYKLNISLINNHRNRYYRYLNIDYGWTVMRVWNMRAADLIKYNYESQSMFCVPTPVQLLACFDDYPLRLCHRYPDGTAEVEIMDSDGCLSYAPWCDPNAYQWRKDADARLSCDFQAAIKKAKINNFILSNFNTNM